MEVVTCPYENIIEINHQGMTYRDEQNKQSTISFQDCRKNWVRYVNASSEFAANDLREEKTKCVGMRNICANPPYIEIFSTPRIKFVFHDGKTLMEWIRRQKSAKARRQFKKIQSQILENNWATLDLS